MFKSIDRFVLSQIEKSTQALQRYFGIKISTITCLFAGIVVICITLDWYFTGIPTPIPLVLDSIVAFGLLLYIVYAAKHQDQVEEWAAHRISNPFKVFTPAIMIRMIFLLMVAVEPMRIARVDAVLIELIGYTGTVSYCILIYLNCVDVLPPSDSKAGAWFKNLFRRRSLST